jgi:quercetin dioxygenase-like cupin family protein
MYEVIVVWRRRMAFALHESNPLMLKNLFQLPDVAGLMWEKFREGIDIHRLYDTAGGPSAALLRYRAGAALQRHVHTGYEHILVLRGSQIDDAGEHVAGTLLVYEPGSSHTVKSPGGCVVLIIWERPVAFIKQDNLEDSKRDIPRNTP